MKRLNYLCFIAGLLLLGSCSTTKKTETNIVLKSTTWELATIKGKSPDPNEFQNGLPFISFNDEARMSGFTGCNRMSGKYELEKSNLKLDPGAVTRMACPGNGELVFLESLSHVKNIKAEPSKLILLDGGIELMTLHPKKND